MLDQGGFCLKGTCGYLDKSNLYLGGLDIVNHCGEQLESCELNVVTRE